MMHARLLSQFVRRFSFLQQYIIILSLCLPCLILCRCWWYILLLPLSTIIVYNLAQRLAHAQKSPLTFTGHLYDHVVRKRSRKTKNAVG
jgi:hypothetical protein